MNFFRSLRLRNFTPNNTQDTRLSYKLKPILQFVL